MLCNPWMPFFNRVVLSLANRRENLVLEFFTRYRMLAEADLS